MAIKYKWLKEKKIYSPTMTVGSKDFGRGIYTSLNQETEENSEKQVLGKSPYRTCVIGDPPPSAQWIYYIGMSEVLAIRIQELR